MLRYLALHKYFWVNKYNQTAFVKAKEFGYRELFPFPLIFQNITRYKNHMHILDS